MSNNDKSPKNSSKYNESQVHEKELFLILLKELCQGIKTPEQPRGRPRVPLSDILFCLNYQVYAQFSTRRFMTDLRTAHKENFITRVPHFNCLSYYQSTELVTAPLFELIKQSSLPLSFVENVFAADSTGLTTCQRRNWFNRHKGKVEKRRRWLKLHGICGVQTNIVTSAQVTDEHVHDSLLFGEMVRNTALEFRISEVSADAGYIAAHNQRQVLLLGGIPYIAYRSNSTAYGEPKSTFWKQTVQLFHERKKEFMERYYKRNNIESTFSMIKARFGDRLRGRSDRSQINEALCKVVCHNLCVLIQAIYELAITPKFWTQPAESQGKAASDKNPICIPERLTAIFERLSIKSGQSREEIRSEAEASARSLLYQPSLFGQEAYEDMVTAPASIYRPNVHINNDSDERTQSKLEKDVIDLPLFRDVA